MYCIPKKEQTGHEKASLCCRRNLSWVSNICEAPNGLNKVQKVCFHPDGQINKGFLTGQSWCILKSWGAWNKDFDTVSQTL